MEAEVAKSKIKELADTKKDPRIDEVGFLLLDFKLECVACGDDTRIQDRKGNVIGQVDLVIKDEEIEKVFLIEVSTKRDNRSQKINSFFSRWKAPGNLQLIREKLSITETFSVYRIFFELSGKNTLPEGSGHIVDQDDNAVLFDNDLRYFVDSYGKINIWAKNDLYSFLEIKPLGHEIPLVEVKGMQFDLGGVRAYLYLDRVDRLLKYCYIFRRIDEDKGYQRMLSDKRIRNIAKKIAGGNLLAFPNTILISSPDDFAFCDSEASSKPESVKVKTPNYFCACRVVDGQHRLLGFANLSKEHQQRYYLPVIALEGIPQLTEMRTFVDINSTQVQIDRNLILTLEADFQWDKETNAKEYFEKQAVDVISRLNKESASALKNRVYIPKALEERKQKITLATFVYALINNNFIGGKKHLYQQHEGDIETPYKRINYIFTLIRKHLSGFFIGANAFLLTNKGFRMFFRFLQIYERNKKKNRLKCSDDILIKDLGGIINNRFVKKLKQYYGEGGANKAAEEVWKRLKVFRRRYKNVTTNLRKLK